MRYWWVNQNQTYRHEVQGGYLWSPKRNANGARNPFYESMREVAPGDLILSFMDTRILAVGIAQSYCWESPKPLEFGTSGQNWENVGWRVKVHFTELRNKVRPKDHIEILRPLLPDRYSPLQPNGNGLQSVYLTEVPTPLAEVLFGLIGAEVAPIARSAGDVMPVSADDLDTWERKLEEGVADDAAIPETDRLAIIRARKGQGLFKERVGQIESRCRITGVENPAHLIASHCKPWRDSTNEERLNGENGLLLTPSIDHLFDRGFIGFEDNGKLIVSPVAHRPSLQRMGIDVALGHGMMDMAGDEVDSRRKRDRAQPLVFMITLHGSVLAWPGRQIRCGGGNRLDAGFLIVGDHGNRPFRLRQISQHVRRRVNVQDFGFALVKVRVAAFEVVAHLVRLDRLTVQDVMHCARCGFRQAGMTGDGSVAARMRRQQTQRPEFVRIAALFRFDAGLADQPGPRRFGDLRRASRAGQILDCLDRSHGSHPPGATRDPLAVDAESCGDLGSIAAVGQVQDDGGSLDMVSRSGA
jgi:hypothetical protein